MEGCRSNSARLIAEDWRQVAVEPDAPAAGRSARLAVNVAALVAAATAAGFVLPAAAGWNLALASGELPLGLTVIAFFVILGSLTA